MEVQHLVLVKTQVKTREVILDANASPSTTAGTIFYDSTAKTAAVQTGVASVINQLGQEHHVQVYNDSGVELANGTPVYISGIDATTGLMEVTKADASVSATSKETVGLVTATIANGASGMVTQFGIVRDIDTSALAAGSEVYLSETTGTLTTTRPYAPAKVVSLGHCLVSDASVGQIQVHVHYFNRPLANKSYSFVSPQVTSGTFYIGGYYRAPAADVTLTQGSLTQTYGGASHPYAAHAFIVGAGGATIDDGDVGIKVTGTSITDAGVRTTSDEEILSANISEIETDEYIETSKKWLGQVTFTLYDAVGTPATYTTDLNYGLCKYEDFGNRDFTLTDIECVGLAGANDAGFELYVIKHDTTGWTYSPGSFVPGSTPIYSMAIDHSTDIDLDNGDQFAWKRAGLSTFISGSTHEGIVIRIDTAANSAIDSLDFHVGGEIETF